MVASEIRPGMVRRVLSGIGRLLANLGRSVWRWADKRRRMGRIRREIRRLEARRHQLCQGLGERVYLLFQRNNVRHPDLLVLCEEIRDLDVEIDVQEENYRNIYTEGITVRTEGPLEVADEPLERRITTPEPSSSAGPQRSAEGDQAAATPGTDSQKGKNLAPT